MKRKRNVIIVVSSVLLLLCCTDGEQYRRVLDRAQEQNLNRATITDIDSIQMASGYFDRHGTNNDKVRAYYLLGCAYRDAGEAPNALEAFHDAADRADTTSADCDYGLLMRVHAQSAMLFKKMLLSKETIDELNAQRRCAMLAGDDKNAITAIERSADAYRLFDMKDSAVNIQLRASDLYEQYGFHEEAALAAGPIINDLVERGDTAEARKCIERYETSKSIFRDGELLPHKVIHYYNKGKYFLAIGKTDSAEINFRKLLLPGRDPQQMEAGYRGLFLLYWQEEKWDSMAKYSNLQYEQTIPALADKNAERVQQMQGLYNYSRIQNEAKKTAVKNEHQMILNIILVCVAIILLMTLVGIYKYQQWKRRMQQLEYEKLLYEYEKETAELAKVQMELKISRGLQAGSPPLDKALMAEMEKKILLHQQRIEDMEKNLGSILQRPLFEVSVNTPGNQIISEQKNEYHKD